MGFFSERIETEDKIIIRFRFYAVYILMPFIVLGAMISLLLQTNVYFASLVATLTLLFLLIFQVFTKMYEPLWEIQKASKEGRVKISGSRIFPWNPFTAEISKAAASP